MTKSQTPNDQQIPNVQSAAADQWSRNGVSLGHCGFVPPYGGLGIGHWSLVILTPHCTHGYDEQPGKSSQKNKTFERNRLGFFRDFARKKWSAAADSQWQSSSYSSSYSYSGASTADDEYEYDDEHDSDFTQTCCRSRRDNRVKRET